MQRCATNLNTMRCAKTTTSDEGTYDSHWTADPYRVTVEEQGKSATVDDVQVACR